VYRYLLKSGHPVGVREVQKALNFSSPSIAHHHLEQLSSLGLAKKQDVGNYYVLVSEVKIGVLRHYVRLGRLLFPRYFFYGLFTTSMYLIFLLFFVERLSRESVFILLSGAIVCLIFWYEAYRFWSLRPY